MKNPVLLIMILCMILIGCQKTPDKSAVVSKADGLSEEIVLEPLKSGEKRTTDIPEHWQMNEKKNNDRLILAADLELGKIEIGNLPIKEMKNHVMSQEKLEELVSYFAKAEELYVPQIYTKDVYQENINRIEHKEGAYADMSLRLVFKEIEAKMKEAVELAPEAISKPEKPEIKFQKKIEDPALAAAHRWAEETESKKESGAEIYFSADVGEVRTGRIDAQCYDSDVENSSSFSWNQGGNIIEHVEIQSSQMRNSFTSKTGQDITGYTAKFENLLIQYETCLEQEPFGQAEGEEQAEQVLVDLDITDMKLSSSDKVLWFPKGAIPERAAIGTFDDLFWQGDLGKVEVGYQYIFSPNIEGISVEQEYGIVTDKTADSYSPSFPVETVTIIVTTEGIKSFSWKGMAEEVNIVADNSKLLSFKTIQEQLLDQVFYWGASGGQPASDPTLSTYSVISAQLRYTHIPAYEKPANAWLVPAWFFVVRENVGGVDVQNLDFVINALDGGIIGKIY